MGLIDGVSWLDFCECSAGGEDISGWWFGKEVCDESLFHFQTDFCEVFSEFGSLFHLFPFISNSRASSRFCEDEGHCVGIWTMALFIANGGGVCGVLNLPQYAHC